MFAHGLSVHRKCSNYALTNLLFGLCRFMWMIDQLVTRPSPHLGALACPSTFEVLRARECTLIPYPFVIFTLDYQGAWGCVKRGWHWFLGVLFHISTFCAHVYSLSYVVCFFSVSGLLFWLSIIYWFLIYFLWCLLFSVSSFFNVSFFLSFVFSALSVFCFLYFISFIVCFQFSIFCVKSILCL
jgi:hypothetical protein